MTTEPLALADGYAARSLSDMQAEIEKIDDEFPNYGDFPITLPAGHWRAILAALLRTPATSERDGG